MAQRLIEMWRLTVLRVQLDVAGEVPAVAVQMVVYPEGAEQVLWTRRYLLDEFGLPDTARLTGTETLSVPHALVMEVRGTLASDKFEGKALWLYLVPPHGYLGAIRWERALVPRINVPLLRVPDRFPLAQDPGRTWSVAIVAEAGPGATWPAEHIPALISALDTRVSAVPLEVHLFVSNDLARRLAKAVHRLPVQIHDPQHEPAAKSRNWIAGTLRRRALSAVHLLGDAMFDGDRAMLGLPGSSGVTDYRDAEAIAAIADSVGAATVSFGSPPGNPSDLATRVLANAVGFHRPGPTLYVDVSADQFAKDTAAAHAFLATPGATVPTCTATFLYLQPERVRDVLVDTYPELAEVPAGTSPGDDVLETYANAEELPGWVSSSERYVDSKVGELVRAARVETPVVKTKQAYDEGTHRGLAELRSILDRHVRRSS